MNPELHHAVTQRLTAEFGLKISGDGKKLKDGTCPSCGKKELWAFAESPWMVRCNRINKCGYEEHIKALYDDLFNDWSTRHPITPEKPDAAADAYMETARGFDLVKIKGWYRQESYYDHKQQIGSATVRIELPDIGYFERIIDQPWRFGSRKATIHGKYQGRWWTPPIPNFLDESPEVWIVEGIFDAIALHHAGITAVSSLCANHYPHQALKDLIGRTIDTGRPTLVWALDGDKAGRNYTKKWVERARAEGWICEAATIPQNGGSKQDWNDLLQRGKLTTKHLEEYRYHGSLLIAQDVQEKARLIFTKKKWQTFHLDFENRLYWFALDAKGYQEEVDKLQKEGMDIEQAEEEALKRNGHAAEIANCVPVPLYHQWNRKNAEDVQFYFRIERPNDEEIRLTFGNGSLASSPEFMKRLLAARSVWKGSQKQLVRLLPFWTENLKSVETIDHIGYVPEHSCYVLSDIAIKAGKVYPLNDEDFFSLDKRLAIKPPQDLMLIKPNTDKRSNSLEWLRHLTIAFGDKGLITLAFWLGAIYSCQIVKLHKSYPFLAMTGAPGTGKSTLVMLMWKLYGRVSHGDSEYEGFDPAKATASAFRRNMGQSSFPVVFTEADRENVQSPNSRPNKLFDWDVLKNAFNHGPVGSRGIKDNTNRTKEDDFIGSIVIVQNAKVLSSEAIQERLVDLEFVKEGLTEETNRSAEFLEHLESEAISYFLFDAISREAELLAVYAERYKVHYKFMGEAQNIRNYRVRKCHAQLLALLDALGTMLPIRQDDIDSAQVAINRMAKAKEQSLSKDHPILEEFWGVFEYLQSTEEFAVDHSADPDLLAINLNDFENKASLARQRIPPISEIRRLLPTGRTHKLQDIPKATNPRTVTSVLRRKHNQNLHLIPVENRVELSESLKCWIFEK